MAWALVTGASAGIGYELSHCFAAAGHSIVIVARRKAQLTDLAQEITKKYPSVKVEVISEDLTSAGAAGRINDRIQSLGIQIEFLVNNAGFGSSGKFYQLPLERELQMIDLNIRVLVELTGLFLPEMVKRGSGRILNVGSMAGFQPGPYMATYYATKAFVNSYSEALSEELQGTGVTVTVLAPGPVATEFGQVSNMNMKNVLAGPASAEEVAQYGFDSMMKGMPVAIHGAKFKALHQAQRLTPRFVSRKLVGHFNRAAKSD